MPRSPFDLPDYPITLSGRYRLRTDAERQWPQLAIVAHIQHGRIKFEDASNGDLYETTTPQFREAYDPA